MAPELYCSYLRLCPWCYARKAVEIYKTLSAGPLRDPKRKLLVQARVSLNSTALGFSPEEQENINRMGGVSTTAWWSQGNFQNYYLKIWLSMVVKMQRLRKALRRHAQALGVQGGLVVYQVGPDLHEKHANSFVHELNLLGEVPCRTDAERLAFEKKAGIAGDQCEGDVIGWDDCWADVTWLTLPADTPNALRFLLAGTSTSYPVDQLDLGASEEANEILKIDRNGLPGVFGLPPAFMFGPIQWKSVSNTLKNVHLCDTFGTWRLGTERGRQPVRAAEPSGNRPGDSLRLINEARGAASRAHREELLRLQAELKSKHRQA